MKKISSAFLCLVLLFSASATAFAYSPTVYYIDSVGGDDSNSGTVETSPWKTVANIQGDKLSYGDKILFKRGGVYEVTNLTITSSGSIDEPIVISSYGDGENARLNTDAKAEILRPVSYTHLTLPTIYSV